MHVFQCVRGSASGGGGTQLRGGGGNPNVPPPPFCIKPCMAAFNDPLGTVVAATNDPILPLFILLED